MKTIARGLCACLVALGLAGAAAGQSREGNLPVAEPHTPQTPSDFGDRINTLQIPAAAFVPKCSSVPWQYSSSGFLYATGNTCANFPVEVMWAPVALPTGARIYFLDLYYDDTDVDDDIEVGLNGYPAGAGITNIASASSSGNAGIGYASSPLLNYTVNNDLQYDPQGRQLAVVLIIPNATAALKFKGADIWWVRQVSPAPAAATFNDVPTDHPFFQFIQALALSNITGGCNTAPPLYCPNNFVTRGQMAVFLAKALGLAWFDQGGIF